MRLLFLLVAIGCSGPRDPMTPPLRKRIVAHRGASIDAPENTLAAFRRAWELGAEACELDVRLSKDGEVVVFHDESTKRITGVDKPVAQQTLAELKQLDAGRGERIPTLAEALATIPAGHTIHVEIKSGPETAPAIAKVIRASGNSVVLQGYPADALAALAKELPTSPAFWDLDPPMQNGTPQPYALTIIADAKQRGFAGLALDVRGVTDELLAAARDAGILMDVWTLNDRELIKTWSGKEVRWIETDRPDLAP